MYYWRKTCSLERYPYAHYLPPLLLLRLFLIKLAQTKAVKLVQPFLLISILKLTQRNIILQLLNTFRFLVRLLLRKQKLSLMAGMALSIRVQLQNTNSIYILLLKKQALLLQVMCIHLLWIPLTLRFPPIGSDQGTQCRCPQTLQSWKVHTGVVLCQATFLSLMAKLA